MKGSKVEITPELTKAIVTKKVLGGTVRELEEEFGYSRPIILRILNSELAQSLRKEVLSEALAEAAQEIRQGLSSMSGLALGALKSNLEKKSMEAVKTYFQALGVTNNDKTPQQQQAFQIIMPSGVKTVEAEKVVVSENDQRSRLEDIEVL